MYLSPEITFVFSSNRGTTTTPFILNVWLNDTLNSAVVVELSTVKHSVSRPKSILIAKSLNVLSALGDFEMVVGDSLSF